MLEISYFAKSNSEFENPADRSYAFDTGETRTKGSIFKDS